MKKTGFNIFLLLLCLVLIIPVVRGKAGTPFYYQKPQEMDTKIGSPFELSNSISRYVLTEAIVNNQSFFLSLDQARAAAPDVVDYKGKFISIFTPGVSFLGIPFYALGKLIGMPQLITYALITAFGLLDIFLISVISQKLGAGKYSGLIAGVVFLFATNALSYSQTFTQHLISTACILSGLLLAIRKSAPVSNLLLGFIISFSLLVDLPNLIFLIPAGLYILSQSFRITINEATTKIKINLTSLLVVIGMIPGVILFSYYNYQTTGSFTKLAQFIGRTHFFRDQLPVQNPADNSYVEVGAQPEIYRPYISLPFDSRLQINGLFILLFSNERSWIYYSPIVLLGLVGLLIGQKESRTNHLIILLLSTGSLIVVTYSLFGDPWGGWAFGPRYLIPAAAILCTGLGRFIHKWGRKIIPALIFIILLVYSVFISSLGALTTDAIPPKVEAINLPNKSPYTYELNLKMITQNQASSLLYNILLSKKITLQIYLLGYSAIVSMFVISLYFLFYKNETSGV